MCEICACMERTGRRLGLSDNQMNQIFSQVEGRVKKGVVQILTNNMLLSITLTIFAMMLLKAFALDRKTLLRAFLILTVVNYAVLKATQDIRLPGEGFLREAFHQPIQNMNRRFILANNIESEEHGSSEESESPEDEREGGIRQEAQ